MHKDGQEGRLTADKAFVALSLFNILSTPMTMLPIVISSVVQVWSGYQDGMGWLWSGHYYGKDPGTVWSGHYCGKGPGTVWSGHYCGKGPGTV